MNRKRLPFLIVGIVILSIFLLFSLFPQLFTNYGNCSIIIMLPMEKVIFIQ
mgnify:CR=1 FL=1